MQRTGSRPQLVQRFLETQGDHPSPEIPGVSPTTPRVTGLFQYTDPEEASVSSLDVYVSALGSTQVWPWGSRF